MKRIRTAKLRVAALAALLICASRAPAGVVTNDYSWVHGTHYDGGKILAGDAATISRELGYGRRVGLNAIRFWVSPGQWRKNPADYERRLRDFVRLAWEQGYYSMPILFNGNSLNPKILPEKNWNDPAAYASSAYAAGVVKALREEPGLLMWDVMNEPLHGNRWPSAPKDEAEKETRREAVCAFARRAAAFVKSVDPASPVTIGCESIGTAERLADAADVISFHTYDSARVGVEGMFRRADALRARTGKPVIMSETGCTGHGNPYDMMLEACDRHGFGWFFFKLTIFGHHESVHGVFYADGTTRDPAAVAAMLGIYRNRDLETMVPAKPFWPGKKDRRRVEIAALREAAKKPVATRSEAHDLLERAERVANFLESCELVPMNVPPTARILAWRKMDGLPPPDEVQALALELADALERAIGEESPAKVEPAEAGLSDKKASTVQPFNSSTVQPASAAPDFAADLPTEEPQTFQPFNSSTFQQAPAQPFNSSTFQPASASADAPRPFVVARRIPSAAALFGAPPTMPFDRLTVESLNRSEPPPTFQPFNSSTFQQTSAASAADDGWTFVSVTNGVCDVVAPPPDGDEDLSYHFRCLYDDGGLVVECVVRDDDVATDTCPDGSINCLSWLDDCAEVFLDGELARLPDSRAQGGTHLWHGGEFVIVANGAAQSNSSAAPRGYIRPERAFGGEAATFPDCHYWWTGEAFVLPGYGHAERFYIPWRSMGRDSVPERVGFTISLQDDDGGGDRDHTLYWTGNPKLPHRDERHFGDIVFE